MAAIGSISRSDSTSAAAGDLALAAWAQVRSAPGTVGMPSIEAVHDSGFPLRTAIYRLLGAGPDGIDIVAKRSRRRKANVERAVYESVLPRLPLRTLECFGAVEEEDGEFCWLFLEDAHGLPFGDDGNLELLDEWLADMHTAASELPRPSGLQEDGPVRYWRQLRAGRKEVARLLLQEPANGDRAALEDAHAQLELLEARWPDVVRLCGDVPETLQHGDFTAKNLVVDPTGALVPLDWEGASWGSPAVDLAFVDSDRYLARASKSWPSVTLAAIERAALAGRIFWHMSAIRWATRDYPSQRSVRKLDDHRRRLGRVLRGLGWFVLVAYMLVRFGDVVEDFVEAS